MCVTIVTHNSRQYIETCLQSVLKQRLRPRMIIVVDNASTDGTQEILAGFGERIVAIYNPRNVGFAAAQNQAIAVNESDWTLVLNPDTSLRSGFLHELVESARLDPKVGSVCGRLLACSRDLKPLEPPVFDSAGIYFTPAMRHFDRGWHEPDDGRFAETEYVFGASAAAALYRREMIADISIGGEFFDSAFFAYREDADVAWRAQLLGWRCLYAPRAVGYHVRSVGPVNRRGVPAVLNMHSVKNRFLMRVKNATGGLYKRFWLQATARDLLVLAGCLLLEQRSLGGLWRAAWLLPRALDQRRSIMLRRRVSDEILAQWFSDKPGIRPVEAAALSAIESR